MVARELVARLAARGHDVDGGDDDADGRRRPARPQHAGRDGRRRARDVPRHAAALPLDGDHADAAARAAAPAAARRDACDGLPRPGHHRRCRLVPAAPRSLPLRAGRDVRAAAAEGGPQAPLRLHRDARCRLGRAARGRVVPEGARRRRGGGRRTHNAFGSARTPFRSRRLRATSIRSRASCPLAPRSSSTSAGSRPRRASSTSWRRRDGSPTSTSCSPAPTTGTGRWRSWRPRRRTRGQPAACISCRRRRARRSTSTGGRTCSSSPRAARTSGSLPPRRRRSGRPWSCPTGAGSRRRSSRGEALVVPYDVDATVEAIARVLGDAALRRRLEEGALRAAQRSTWDAVVEEQLTLYAEALAD